MPPCLNLSLQANVFCVNSQPTPHAHELTISSFCGYLKLTHNYSSTSEPSSHQHQENVLESSDAIYWKQLFHQAGWHPELSGNSNVLGEEGRWRGEGIEAKAGKKGVKERGGEGEESEVMNRDYGSSWVQEEMRRLRED